MDLRLSGKRALVTGSSAGIGEGIAMALAQEGVATAVHGRDDGRVDAVVAEIRRTGGTAIGCAADLATDKGAADLVAAVSGELGAIDILVNNAGTYDFRTSWEGADSKTWEARINDNVLSAVRLVRLVLPQMMAAGWGRIVNISSTAAIAPDADMPDYSASKAALRNLTVSLAKYCAGTGITANGVAPGVVLTPGMLTGLRERLGDRSVGQDDASVAAYGLADVHGGPPGGWGYPDEVAYAVLWLASPRARWVSGTELRLDGGMVAGS